MKHNMYEFSDEDFDDSSYDDGSVFCGPEMEVTMIGEKNTATTGISAGTCGMNSSENGLTAENFYNPYAHDADYWAEMSMAANLDEWRIYDPDKDIFEEWLEENLPSKICRSSGVGWICVRSPVLDDPQTGDVNGLQMAWEELRTSRYVSESTILNLGLQYGVITGKWILHVGIGAKADHVWSVIARGIVEGRVPASAAKISPHEDLYSSKHVICLFNNNFDNEAEVVELEQSIRKNGIYGSMCYKPNVYTCLGIYRNNEWSIRPSIYASDYDLISKKSIFRKFGDIYGSMEG